MKITKRHLRRIIKEEKAMLEQSWRENPAKIRRQRRLKDRQRMIDQMTFKQLKRRAFDSALFINNRLDTGQYEYADIWEAEIPGLADTIDAAKVKAAEEGVTYDDIPEVRHQGGILDLSRYSLPGLPAGIEENTVKITESELRGVISEIVKGYTGHGASSVGGRKLGINPPSRRKVPEQQWMDWAEHNNLHGEYEPTGELVYFTNDPDIAAEAEEMMGSETHEAGGGPLIIYTGVINPNHKDR